MSEWDREMTVERVTIGNRVSRYEIEQLVFVFTEMFFSHRTILATGNKSLRGVKSRSVFQKKLEQRMESLALLLSQCLATASLQA